MVTTGRSTTAASRHSNSGPTQARAATDTLWQSVLIGPAGRFQHVRPLRAPATSGALVLSNSTALSQLVIRGLGLRRAAAFRLDGALTCGRDRLREGSPPKLAIVVESNVSAVTTAIQAVKRRWRDIRVLVVGLPNSEGAILDCLAAGADGLLAPEEELPQLVQAVSEVIANFFRPPPYLVRPVFDRLIRLNAKTDRQGRREFVTRLSAREVEILTCLVRGESNKQMAVELHLEVQTIKNHVGRIMRKLGVRNRYDAARLASEYAR